MTKLKKFNGKIYIFHVATKTKRLANIIKKELKNEGKLVRITKDIDDEIYYVWRR